MRNLALVPVPIHMKWAFVYADLSYDSRERLLVFRIGPSMAGPRIDKHSVGFAAHSCETRQRDFL
jgi:hypothetical protein